MESLILGGDKGETGWQSQKPRGSLSRPCLRVVGYVACAAGIGATERITEGLWERKLPNTSTPSLSATTMALTLAEGMVVWQDGLTHSGLTSQDRSGVKVVLKEEETQINVFRQ